MTARLVIRALGYYWRTNLAVVLGVATAVSVLAGALLVGDSVRGSLRDLVLQRLGRTDQIVVSTGFFREALAADLRADDAFGTSFDSLCPLIVVQGVVSPQSGGRRVFHVPVYGVDDRFWRFHGVAFAGSAEFSGGREALVSAALASEIGVAPGDAILVRVERPSAVPIESLHGRKEDAGRTMRLTVGAAIGTAELGEFSLRPQQGAVRAVFVPLSRLQDELDLAGRVNTLLVSARAGPLNGSPDSATARALPELLRRRAALDDVGLTVRVVGADGAKALAVESRAGLVDEAATAAANQTAAAMGMSVRPVFTYLANTLRAGSREIPYSLVAAIDVEGIEPGPEAGQTPPIILNEWAARDLGVRAGDPLTLDYYIWEEPGRLRTRTTDFRVAVVVPIAGAAADRDLAPVYSGITEARTFADWDPPFPIDLRRIRPLDEEYWDTYRTTPKAFVPFEVGQRLWSTRYGDRTSMRVTAQSGQLAAGARDDYAARLRAAIDPLAMGLAVQDVRSEGLAASRGATDFGEYFTYFSFFLVVSALLLTALFFRLGVEQRAREVGLLRAVGYPPARIRRLFAAEGFLLAVIGSLLGVAGAIGYAWLMMTGLGSWWSGAVGTDALRLHVSATSLAVGAGAAIAAAMACIWWTLRGLSRISERRLLAGQLAADVVSGAGRGGRPRRLLAGAIVFGLIGGALLALTVANVVPKTGAFFGAGFALLVASLCLLGFALQRPGHAALGGSGWWPVSRLGMRNAAVRPGRSVLVVAVIAAATFIVISVDAFRRGGAPATDRRSGVGGYPLLVDLLVPLAYDPESRDGRERLGLDDASDVRIEPFRVLPGDDASCLNLYEPRNPRILGARQGFLAAGRFAFQSSLASTDTERQNPWLLLERQTAGDGELIVPVIADANSMTYALHKALGEEIVVERAGQPVRLRFVAALSDSIFQSEVLMSEANFLRLFPGEEGYQFLLVDTPFERAADVAKAIESGGRDSGASVVSTTARLAEFHRVENTYISTFQTLGGLGLLLGTVGLATVLLRNVFERRRDLALLGAVGFRKAFIVAVVLAENVLLLLCGLAIGTLCALLAVVPAVSERGVWTPMTMGGWVLLAGVLVVGLLSSIVATGVALRAPLLSALRSE